MIQHEFKHPLTPLWSEFYDLLTNTPERQTLFSSKYDDTTPFSIMSFREDLLQTNRYISETDPRLYLQELFLEPISSNQYRLVLKLLNSNNLTITDVRKMHNERPTLRILRFLL